MSAIREYPFGIAPKDAFAVATCPVCSGNVGPGLHYCPTCFVTDDLAKAREDVIFRGGAEASVARNVHLMVLVLGAVVLLLGLVLGGLESPVTWAGGALLATGAVGWLAYPRFPRPASIVALVLVALLCVLLTGLALVAGGGLLLLLVGGAVAGLVVVLRGTLAGIRVGARVARLRLRT